MERKLAEENWRKKFNEFGLSERFEFVGRDWNSDHGKNAFVRCKSCGEEFATYGVCEVFRGRQKHLLCVYCRVSSDDGSCFAGRKKRWTEEEKKAVAEYYASGHSASDTAKKFGRTKYSIENFVKDNGLLNGRAFVTDYEMFQTSMEESLPDRLREKGFEYLGGYTNKKGKVRVRCMKCGHETEIGYDRAKRESFRCMKCEHDEIVRRNAEKEDERKAERKAVSEKKKVEALEERKKREQQKADALNLMLTEKTHKCVVCGSLFSIQDYMDDCSLIEIQHNPKYCSAECKKKHTKQEQKNYRKLNHTKKADNNRHRARKYGGNYESGITLAKMIKRDGLRCALCGGLCNPDDHSWSKYSGPTYPSIDHIIPMSKGGSHTWDNVQVAHIMCNSLKGASL